MLKVGSCGIRCTSNAYTAWLHTTSGTFRSPTARYYPFLQGCQRVAGILAELTGQRQALDDSRYSVEIVKLTKGCKGGRCS